MAIRTMRHALRWTCDLYSHSTERASNDIFAGLWYLLAVRSPLDFKAKTRLTSPMGQGVISRTPPTFYVSELTPVNSRVATFARVRLSVPMLASDVQQWLGASLGTTLSPRGPARFRFRPTACPGPRRTNTSARSSTRALRARVRACVPQLTLALCTFRLWAKCG